MEELNHCPKCRQTSSFLYNSFDEVVSYVHCACKKNKPKLIDGMKPLDYAIKKIDLMIKEGKYDLPQ